MIEASIFANWIPRKGFNYSKYTGLSRNTHEGFGPEHAKMDIIPEEFQKT